MVLFILTDARSLSTAKEALSSHSQITEECNLEPRSSGTPAQAAERGQLAGAISKLCGRALEVHAAPPSEFTFLPICELFLS